MRSYPPRLDGTERMRSARRLSLAWRPGRLYRFPARDPVRSAPRTLPGLLVAALCAVAPGAFAAGPIAPAGAANKTEVIFAGSNWEGTVEVMCKRKPFERIAQINVIPDLDERLPRSSSTRSGSATSWRSGC